MSSDQDVDPTGVFTALADIVNQGSSPKEMYAAVCVAATLMVPGCDHASLMVFRDGSYSTAAASDAVARQIDKLEQALVEGPCMVALEKRTTQIESDLTTGTRWPELTARVVAETPVRGAIGIRLPVDRGTVAALNLFSDTPNAFDNTSVERGIMLAAFATAAAHAAARGEESAALRRGLVSNRTIGKAIGMLMVLNDVSDDDAFEMLRQTSQDTNVKLLDIAAGVVSRRGQDA